MPVIRLILLLVVLGGLTLLLAQNWSPALPLVFLGVKTQAFPLAVWILISLAAGAFTSLLLAGLFKLSNYFARRSLALRRNVKAPPPRASAQRSEAPKAAATSSKPDTDSTPPSDSDDWESGSTNDDDDWDFEEDTDKARNYSSQNTVRDSTSYEVSTEPKSGYQSGSVYSYSYREPSNSGVGKTESVYDANYRVVTPPYRQTDTAKEDEDWGVDEDEDWGFDDDDDKDGSRK